MKKNNPANSSGAELPIAISRPDKIFWPEEGYTKRDLAEYYRSVFPKLSPYVEDRLLTLERCPDGMQGECFYQKQAPKGMPPGTPTKRLEHIGRAGKFTDYVVGGSLVTQLALVNLGCIAVHVMATRAASPRQPDWICIDIDPESGRFADAARAATQSQGRDGSAEATVVSKDFWKSRIACVRANSRRTGRRSCACVCRGVRRACCVSASE